VDLTQHDTLHGLAERVVAVESLVFLAKQWEFLHSYLEHLQERSSFLQQFFSQVCVRPSLLVTEVSRENTRSNIWQLRREGDCSCRGQTALYAPYSFSIMSSLAWGDAPVGGQTALCVQ
jgi:hypothetical protein